MKRLLSYVLIISGLSASAVAAPSTFVPSSFVPPATPTVASSNAPAPFVAAGYGVKYASSMQTRGSSRDGGDPLFAKKKKAVAGKGGKVQVKLLKHVEGTGKIGDVVMVAPAFFENKLKRTQSAVAISDEEVSKEREEKAKQKKETLDAAKQMQGKIENVTLEFPMKAGPDGHLFGGVNYKAILTELTKQFPKGALGKNVKVQSVKDEGGKTVPHDIKELGDYTATVSLLKDISADFTVSVTEVK